MWWLIIPVIIYSSGLLVLWFILVRRNDGKNQGDEGLTEGSDAAGAPEAAALPKVSVVVAVRNEEKNITTLLASLAKQDYPDELIEIIIVNDNSTDRTPVAASEFISGNKDKPFHRMRLIYNPFSGKKRAVRYGIEKASGEVILTTDADCIVGPEWVRRHATWYISGSPDLVLAPVVQRPAAGFWYSFGVYEFSALQAITEATAAAGHPVMCNAANMSFRKAVYLKHADKLHHDLASGDDMFLLHAVMHGGGTVMHDGSSAAAVETGGAVTAAALLRQRARWASKASRYRDPATLTLAAATAACNAAVAAAAAATFISVNFVTLTATLYAIKTVPDLLLVSGEFKNRQTRFPVIPFIISELVYPFYFVIVAVMSRIPSFSRFGNRR